MTDYPPDRVRPGIMKRLMTEDWYAMTTAANQSPNHVSSDDRWTRKACEANPALDDDQAYRLGQKLKKAHYVRMGKLSAEARRNLPVQGLGRVRPQPVDRPSGLVLDALPGRLACAPQLKVLRPVVSLVAIDVVHVLFGQQLAA